MHAIGLAEVVQRFGHPLALAQLADPAEGHDDHWLAVHFGGQEGQRRRLAQHHPHSHVVAGRGGKLAITFEHLLRLLQRIHHQSG